MRALADARARQLREQSGFANAGVYDPPSIRGTHVIYVLHDATKPELYGGLPANPRIPASFTVWARRETDRVVARSARRAGGLLPLHHRAAEGTTAAFASLRGARAAFAPPGEASR